MHLRRLQWALPAILTITGLIASSLWSFSDSQPAPLPQLLNRPHRVDVVQNTCCLDLRAARVHPQTLVIGSLGPAGKTYTVRLRLANSSSPQTTASDLHPLRRLTRSRPRPQPSRIKLAHASHTSLYVNRASVLGGTRAAPARKRSFFLHVTEGELNDPRHYAKVACRCVAEGKRVVVYLDEQQPMSPQIEATAKSIVELLEDEIAPRMQDTLGTCRDVDGDGRFVVFLTPWLGRLQGGRTSLQGFVRNTDFVASGQAPLSNACDMLYLNTALRTGTALRTLLAHEYAHVVCFSERMPQRPDSPQLPPEEDWLNEAIAHLAENLSGGDWSNLDHRIAEYLQCPQQYPLVIPNYYQAGLWRNHGCRGATYLFLRWCVDRFGKHILGEMVRAPVRGQRNVAWATGHPFPELFRSWSVALALGTREQSDESPAGISSLDLQGRVGRYDLAGPQRVTWNAEESELTLHLRGTSVAFVDLPPGTAHNCLLITGETGSRLQVTVVPQGNPAPQGITAQPQ